MSKTCACCLGLAPSEVSTCRRCGEASWITDESVPLDRPAALEPDQEQTPDTQPSDARVRRGRRRIVS